jgi:HEAT repeat protein
LSRRRDSIYDVGPMGAPGLKHRLRLPLNVALSLLTTAALLGAIETVGRLLERRQPTPAVERYIWDWERMWDGDFYTVGSTALGWPRDQEFNRDGLRDRAHTVEKPPRTWRLVFLGDSVTMGAGIEAHEAYPRVMADRLAERVRRIEIFNVALWGWSTRQERIAYEKLARRYRPDQVVVAICLNDIPELQNNLSRPPRWLTYLHQHSAFVRVLVNAERREISSVEELFARPDSRNVREGMRRFFDELTALNAQVRADGASLSLLIFPFRFQLQPEAPPPVAQQAIVGYARKMGLPVIDLLPAFKRAGDEVFMDYDHLSPGGARLTAEIILESGWLPEGYSDSRSRAAYRVRVAREDSPALWLSALSDPSAEVREVAAKRLSEANPRPARLAERLATLLKTDPDAGVRAASAAALGDTAGPAAKPQLFGALMDPSEQVRWAAAQTLDRTGVLDAQDVPALTGAFASSDSYVRAFAAWSLGELGPQAAEAVPALIAALGQEDLGEGVAAKALAKMGPAAEAAVPALIKGLQAAEPRRRWNAAQALGQIGPKAGSAIPSLERLLKDDSIPVRAESARALGRIGDEARRSVPAIVALLDDSDAHVRAMAARALGWLGDARALPALEAARRDKSGRVAREATKAIRRITDSKGRSTETEGAPDGDGEQ